MWNDIHVLHIPHGEHFSVHPQEKKIHLPLTTQTFDRFCLRAERSCIHRSNADQSFKHRMKLELSFCHADRSLSHKRANVIVNYHSCLRVRTDSIIFMFASSRSHCETRQRFLMTTLENIYCWVFEKNDSCLHYEKGRVSALSCLYAKSWWKDITSWKEKTNRLNNIVCTDHHCHNKDQRVQLIPSWNKRCSRRRKETFSVIESRFTLQLLSSPEFLPLSSKIILPLSFLVVVTSVWVDDATNGIVVTDVVVWVAIVDVADSTVVDRLPSVDVVVNPFPDAEPR